MHWLLLKHNIKANEAWRDKFCWKKGNQGVAQNGAIPLRGPSTGQVMQNQGDRRRRGTYETANYGQFSFSAYRNAHVRKHWKKIALWTVGEGYAKHALKKNLRCYVSSSFSSCNTLFSFPSSLSASAARLFPMLIAFGVIMFLPCPPT